MTLKGFCNGFAMDIPADILFNEHIKSNGLDSRKGNSNMSDNLITPAELAAEMGISPKNLRRFMRSILDDRAGSGNRWGITPEMADHIRARHAEGNRRVTVPKVPTVKS